MAQAPVQRLPGRRRLGRCGLGRSGLGDHFDHINDFSLHGLLDGLQPAKLGSQVEDVLLLVHRRLNRGLRRTGIPATTAQDASDVVDDPIVRLPFRGLETFVVVVLRRRGGGWLPSWILFVVRDDPANGRENLFHRRLRSSLRAGHDLIPYRHMNPPASTGGQNTWVALE